MQFDRSPAEVWRRYERDRDYKRSIGLYDRVRRNEAFYLGRQWEGLRVQSLDPLIFNVLRRCVNLFVAMLVSDDVAVRVTPFEMNDEGRRTAHVLERAFASAIERSGVKALGRPLLKNACVDGDACFYVHFDPALETGAGPSRAILPSISSTRPTSASATRLRRGAAPAVHHHRHAARCG